MSEETTNQERKEVYAETRRDLLARQLSNSQHFDQAILGLSTGVLALSISFIKDVVPLQQADHLWMLVTAWAFLGLAILCTIGSFVVGQWAIDVQLDFAQKYYVKCEEEYLAKPNPYARPTEWLNWGAGGLFSMGIILLVLFSALNLTKETRMADPKVLKEAAPIPRLQEIEKHAAPIPSMQAIRPVSPASVATTPTPPPSPAATPQPAAPAPKKD